MKNFKLLIVDTVQLSCAGLRKIIAEFCPGIALVELTNEPEIKSFVARNNNCLVMIHGENTGLNSYLLVLDLLRKRRKPKIILIAKNLSNPLITKLIKSGLKGIVATDAPPSEIINAFRSVRAGDTYLFGTEDIASYPSVNLSKVDIRIISLLSDGYTTKEISRIESKSIKTIEKNKLRLFRKTGSRNTAALVDFFFRNNLYGIRRVHIARERPLLYAWQ
jgi:DNA-binding NarL/FixJ family response regulator